ncbi:MAG TPA: phosphate ABC transporter ATP-binding protein [Agrobacterium sp.]|nr:phosphate ABC transporter ATP-binding protein [Agrobacterium sp.]
MISIKNVNKWYGDFQVLTDCSTEVKKGEVVVVCGPSGSGKSTLMHLMAALDTPSEGEVWIGDTAVSSLADTPLTVLRRERIGFVFQAFNLVPTLTARENVVLPLSIAGRRVDEEWFDRLVDVLGIRDRLSHKPSELSGGQQQRLCIARAVAVSPEVILMDEPCSALDPIATAKVEELIHELRTNYTIVIVTHSMQQAARVSQRTAMFHLGHLVEENETDKMFTNPDDQRTQDYIMGRFG